MIGEDFLPWLLTSRSTSINPAGPDSGGASVDRMESSATALRQTSIRSVSGRA